jgi:hypothetical protein
MNLCAIGNGDHGVAPVNTSRIREAVNEYLDSSGDYIDVHAWQFIPSSFRTIMQLLFEMKLTRTLPIRVYDTPFGWNEFYAILKKT